MASDAQHRTGGVSPLTRLGVLAAFVTPFAVLPYLFTRRRVSSLRWELGELRRSHRTLQRELRIHEDLFTSETKRLHGTYRALAQEVESLTRKSDIQIAPAVDTKSSSLQGARWPTSSGKTEIFQTPEDTSHQRVPDLEDNLCAVHKGFDDKFQGVLPLCDHWQEMLRYTKQFQAEMETLRRGIASEQAAHNEHTDNSLVNTLDEVSQLRGDIARNTKSFADLDSTVDTRFKELWEYLSDFESRFESPKKLNHSDGDIQNLNEQVNHLFTTGRSTQDTLESLKRTDGSRADEIRSVASQLQKQNEDIQRARNMQVAVFQVLRASLVDLAAFVEGTESVVGLKYDNGQANRLRRMAIYLRDCQGQLHDEEPH